MARALERPNYLSPSKLGLCAAILVAVVLLFLFRDRIDLGALHEHAHETHGGLIALALFLLPLVGFPAAVLQAVTGAKFGLPVGMAVVGASIACHLAMTWLLVHAAPGFFANRFKSLRDRLPNSSHRTLTLFTMFLPGAPYFAQNYALAIAGVPLRMLFLYCFPIHFTRSFIGVIFGEWIGNFTPGRIAVMVVYNVVITLICALAFRRLRAQLRNPRPAAGGRKPRG